MLSASGTKNCAALPVCTPLDVFSMRGVCECEGECFHKDLHTCMSAAWVRCYHVCRLLQLLFLLLFSIYSNFPISLLPTVSPLLLPSRKDHQTPAIHAERIKILGFSLFFFPPALPNESVAKQLLSGSAREHGIWYQAPSYLCEQPPRSNFHGV